MASTLFGVFVPGQEKAVALFRDADEAQAYRKRTYGADSTSAQVVEVSSANASAPDDLFPVDEVRPDTSALEVQKSQAVARVRDRILQEELDKAVEKDVRAEVRETLGILDDDDDGESEDSPSPAPFAEATHGDGTPTSSTTIDRTTSAPAEEPAKKPK